MGALNVVLEILAWISLGWYSLMVLMALSGSVIAFRKFRKPPPPPPFPLSSSPPSQASSPSAIRPSSKTQKLLIPSVSILRPLCGLDYGLRENLESSFLQQWPLDRFEIIFCVADELDPAAAVAEELIKKYPAVHARLLIGEAQVGVNPKINNLIEAYRTAKADLLWILDSNARVHPTTLARAVSVLSPSSGPTTRNRTRIGLVHHVPAGILCKPDDKHPSQRGFGCLLEACFLNGNHARQYLTLNALGVASCLMGKSNLFYRSDLEHATRRLRSRGRKRSDRFDTNANEGEGDEQAGLLSSSGHQSPFDALELFGQFLGEDNMIGQTLWDDGIRHATTIDVVGNVIGPLSVREYFLRRIRWIRARKYMQIVATLVEPFTESILLGILMALALEKLNLNNGIEKKILMMIHEVVYFALDYSVHRSMSKSPLMVSQQLSTSQDSNAAKKKTFNTTATSSSITPSPSSSSNSNPVAQEEEPERVYKEEPIESIQVRLSFIEFSIGWMIREFSAFFIWIIAISSDKVYWRKNGKILRVLRHGRVAEMN